MGPRREVVEGLGQDIRGVLLGFDVVEADVSGGDGFADTVVGQGIPALGQGGMWDGR